MAVTHRKAGLKILVIEDDPEVRSITCSMARELGHTVIDAENAEEALELLRETPVDTLIADIVLPGMSGDVFAARARGMQPLLSIVFATGSGAFAGFSDDGTSTVVLRKPYDSAALRQALTSVSSRR